jgi:hypothetical protein
VAFVRRDFAHPPGARRRGAGRDPALTALAAQGAALRLRGVSAYVIATCTAAAHAWFGAPLLVFRDIAWSALPVRGRWRDLGAVGIGPRCRAAAARIRRAVRLADAAFESLVTSVRFDVGRAASHVFTGVRRARGRLPARRDPRQPDVVARGELLSPPGLRFATTATALGALDLLFLLFVAVQARWLFGGARTVAETTGLTIAEYARRGFFELVTAAALVLPLLLLADWATQRDTPQQRTRSAPSPC